MGELLYTAYGTLVCAKDSSGRPYADWRSIYLDWPGLIAVRTAEGDASKKLVWLYPYSEEEEQPYFHTSPGDVSYDGCRLVIRTSVSVYEFIIDDGCLGEEQKEKLESAPFKPFGKQIFNN